MSLLQQTPTELGAALWQPLAVRGLDSRGVCGVEPVVVDGEGVAQVGHLPDARRKADAGPAAPAPDHTPRARSLSRDFDRAACRERRRVTPPM